MNLMLTTEAILLLLIAEWLLCFGLEENVCHAFSTSLILKLKVCRTRDLSKKQ